MSIESMATFGDKNFARRNLWDARFIKLSNSSEGDDWYWTKGLIRSVNLPRLSFEISDILAGTNKAYTGVKLPDDIKLSMWETSDHMVEKYLNDWMTGKNGVYNLNTGTFRRINDINNIYRKFEVRTFIYDYVSSEDYEIKIKETKKASDYRTVEKKEPIPILGALASLGGALINQAASKLPVPSNFTKAVFGSVVIPPPLMKVPVSTGSPTPILAPKWEERDVDIASGLASDAKKWEAEEKTTSRIVYTVLIQGYDVGQYDYEKGEGVYYDINLAVSDIQIDTI